MKAFKIIMFDFDGVIVDSFQPAFDVFKKLVSEVNFSEADFRRYYEGNIHIELAKKNEDSVSEIFYKKYIAELPRIPEFVGIEQAIIELSKKYKLIIVSSTSSSPIKDWLSEHNLAQYFVEILGGDVNKDKTEKIKMVFNKYEIGVDDCVFITDSLGDLREANKIGVHCLAVTYGFHDKSALLKGNPAGLVAKPEDIPSEIEKHWSK